MLIRSCLLVILLFIESLGSSFAKDSPYILLQSTTSTKNSGLYAYILPVFKEKTGVDVRVVAVGTGQALKNARNGDADVLLVHAKSAEEEFVREGYGVERFDLMYNDYIIVGPDNDPGNVAEMGDVLSAMIRIADTESVFASRGDNSGTHIKELSLWELSGVPINEVSGDWYRETGSGMGATLNTAVAMQAYTLTDRATWISFGNKQNFKVIIQDDPPMFNQYGVIIVNPEKHPHVKINLAKQFVDWVLSEEGQSLIASYRVSGQQLFFPNAKRTANQ